MGNPPVVLTARRLARGTGSGAPILVLEWRITADHFVISIYVGAVRFFRN